MTSPTHRELPPLLPSDHPEPHALVWSKLEIEAIQAYARSAVAAALEQQAVPQGWKLVPVEPTPEMVQAAFAAVELNGFPGFATGNDVRRAIYRAMLSAAPTPVASEPAQAEAPSEREAFKRFYEHQVNVVTGHPPTPWEAWQAGRAALATHPEQAADREDANRWREIATRFASSKSSASRRILDDLGLSEADEAAPLADAIDAALARGEKV